MSREYSWIKDRINITVIIILTRQQSTENGTFGNEYFILYLHLLGMVNKRTSNKIYCWWSRKICLLSQNKTLNTNRILICISKVKLKNIKPIIMPNTKYYTCLQIPRFECGRYRAWFTSVSYGSRNRMYICVQYLLHRVWKCFWTKVEELPLLF